MDFKELVMHDTDPRYQSMANGTTETPTIEGVSIAVYGEYGEKRRAYRRRLDEEKEEFNRAIKQAKAKWDADIKHGGTILYERGEFRKCLLNFFLGVAWMFFLVRGVYAGWNLWVEETLTAETGFKVFFPEGDTGAIAFYVSVGISFLLWVFWLRKAIDNFVGSAFCGAIFFFLVRLVIVGLGYLATFVINQYAILVIGALTVVVLLVNGAKFAELKRSKIKIFFLVLLTLLVMLFCYFVAAEFADGSSAEEVGDKIGTLIEDLKDLVQ